MKAKSKIRVESPEARGPLFALLALPSAALDAELLRRSIQRGDNAVRRARETLRVLVEKQEARVREYARIVDRTLFESRGRQ